MIFAELCAFVKKKVPSWSIRQPSSQASVLRRSALLRQRSVPNPCAERLRKSCDRWEWAKCQEPTVPTKGIAASSKGIFTSSKKLLHTPIRADAPLLLDLLQLLRWQQSSEAIAHTHLQAPLLDQKHHQPHSKCFFLSFWGVTVGSKR